MMNPNNIRTLTSVDLINKLGRTDLIPIQIERDFYKKLRTNLIIPSSNQAYSMCIEYMSKWFYSKFPNKFFRHKYLEASNVIDQLRSTVTRNLINDPKPVSAITAELDMNFNRENLDLHNLGLNLYSNHCSYKDAFFRDKQKHLFISLCSELLLMNFTFKIKVDTRGLQIDVAKMCQMAFRAGGTQKHYNDVDYPVPKELIMQIADDAGYCICNNNIYDTISFLHYLNSHSQIPFFYKLNTATQNMEWFIKVPRVLVHIRTDEISIDQGNMRGMTNTDYQITFSSQVRFPSPKFYAYYSIIARESIKSMVKIDNGLFIQTVTNLAKVPEIDEHGWQWNIHTEYNFDTPKELNIIKHKELGLDIKFDELLGDLRDVIDYTKSIALSPEVFLNIKVFNYDSIIKSHIDWINYIIYIDEPVESAKCFLIIYIDNAYMNENLSNIRNYSENRIQPSNNVVGPELDQKTYTTQSSSSLSHSELHSH